MDLTCRLCMRKERQQISGLDVQTMHEKTNPLIAKMTSLSSPQPVQAADVTLAISKQEC